MSRSSNLWNIFASTSPGLEDALAAELQSLGVRGLKSAATGCSFQATRADFERIAVSLRTAHRLLWKITDLDAHTAHSLYQSVRYAVRWSGLIPPEKTFAVYATTRDTPAFRDSRFVGLKVKDAIVDAVREDTGTRPDISPHDPDIAVRVSIYRGRGILSLDAAGAESLHARGYRTEAGRAPLRESLAAGLLYAIGWRGQGPLLDPMCGSGTIAIEAALLARQIAPGLLRDDYGFMRWPGFRADRFARTLNALRESTLPSAPSPQIFASDISSKILETALANAERADVTADIQFAQQDARLDPPPVPTGWLLTNPPWGIRMGDREKVLATLRAFTENWANHGHYQVGVLVPDHEIGLALGLDNPSFVPLESGRRAVLLARGTLGKKTNPHDTAGV